MADLCQECGIRLDSDGLCQCPEVLLREIERLRERCDELEFSCEMACETPADGCQCAGCLLADERHARGEI